MECESYNNLRNMREQLLQRTVARLTSYAGVGLHSGKPVSLKIYPADVDTGIKFVSPSGTVTANYRNVVDTTLCTVLGLGKFRLAMVEHLLAAFSICDIHNAIVSVSAQELPILDGSAAPYCSSIAGTECQPPTPLRKIKILKPVQAVHGDSSASLLPSEDGFSISVDVDFSPKLPRQRLRYSKEEFLEHVSSARTFTFESWISDMRAAGMALGGSYENALVFDDNGDIVNPPMRFPDEWARHKLLDCIGDLSLVGAPIEGHYVAHKPGHTINFHLVKQIFDSPPNTVAILES